MKQNTYIYIYIYVRVRKPPLSVFLKHTTIIICCCFSGPRGSDSVHVYVAASVKHHVFVVLGEGIWGGSWGQRKSKITRALGWLLR